MQPINHLGLFTANQGIGFAFFTFAESTMFEGPGHHTACTNFP
jgi:hypothetical protein